VGVISLGAAVEGYFKSRMNVIERLILAAGALMLIIPELYTDIAGMIVVAGMAIFNLQKSKRLSAI